MIGSGKQRGAWVGLVSAGMRLAKADGSVFGDWTVAGRLLLPGYHGQRLVKISGHGQCTVSVKVVFSEDTQPVYTCCYGCEGSAHGEVKGTSSTAVNNQYLVQCGAKSEAGGKRWPGPAFFGFDRTDVVSAVTSAAERPPVPTAGSEHDFCCTDTETLKLTAPMVCGTGKPTDIDIILRHYFQH